MVGEHHRLRQLPHVGGEEDRQRLGVHARRRRARDGRTASRTARAPPPRGGSRPAGARPPASSRGARSRSPRGRPAARTGRSASWRCPAVERIVRPFTVSSGSRSRSKSTSVSNRSKSTASGALPAPAELSRLPCEPSSKPCQKRTSRLPVLPAEVDRLPALDPGTRPGKSTSPISRSLTAPPSSPIVLDRHPHLDAEPVEPLRPRLPVAPVDQAPARGPDARLLLPELARPARRPAGDAPSWSRRAR